jgi:predicted glycoside hydrolase/deacetylase ChbG (UPF0249 family)
MPYTLPQIILKADDYGSMAVSNEATNELVRRGLITDVSVMANVAQKQNAQDLTDAISRSPDPDAVGVILHVNFQTGQPVAEAAAVPSLVDENKCFKRPTPIQSAWNEYASQLNPADVAKELNAQIDRFVELFGRLPDALDSHNIILSVPPVAEIAIIRALELQLAITYPYLYKSTYDDAFAGQILHKDLHQEYRKKHIPTADYAYTHYFNSYEHPKEALIEALYHPKPGGVTQMVFHPVHPNYSGMLTDTTARFAKRLIDYNMLTDSLISEEIDKLRQRGQLTSYKQLRQNLI